MDKYNKENQENTKNGRKGKMPAWAIVLLTLGSPVWLSLLISAVAVVISIFVTVWSVIG